MKNKIIIGIDLSLNHWGICSLDLESGQVFETGIMTDLKMFFNTKSVTYEYHLKPWDKKKENKNNFVARRRKRVSEYIWYCILLMLSRFCGKKGVLFGYLPYENVYVAIEDYAFGLHSQGILENAEVCGILKNSLYGKGINLRLIDPSSMKKWATGKGHCLKKETVTAAWGEGFEFSTKLIKEVDRKVKKETVEEFDGPGTDLADAYFLAQMLRTELLVREGSVEIKNLSEHRRDIFLRVTDRFPENLLVRPFICKRDKNE